MNVILSIKYICKIIFLSVEAIFTLCMLVIYPLKLNFFSELGVFLYSNSDVITIVTIAAPVAVFMYSLSIQKLLLQPEEVNTILVKWLDYKKYKMTTVIGILFCALPIFPSIMAWMNKDIYQYMI